MLFKCVSVNSIYLTYGMYGVKINLECVGGVDLSKCDLVKQGRLAHIDLMESIAIFFVVTYHATAYSFDFLNYGSVSDYLLYFFRTILSTCVPIFFFANGYLLLNKSFDFKKHIKKIVHIVLIIFIWALILMPLYLFVSGQPISLKSIIVPVLNMDTGWSMNVFWYLGALICIYILFPLLKLAFDKDKKIFFFFTIVCGILTFGFKFFNEIVLLLSSFTHSLENGLELPILTMFNPFRGSFGYSFVYFCVGGILSEYEDKVLLISKTKRNVIPICGILISCTCLFAMGVLHSKLIKGEVWDIVWNGYDTVFTFLNVIFIYVICLNYKKDYSFIRNVSVNTLGIYFIHGLLLRLTNGIFEFEILRNLPFNLVYSFVILCICLIISIVMKKIPVLKKLV